VLCSWCLRGASVPSAAVTTAYGMLSAGFEPFRKGVHERDTLATRAIDSDVADIEGEGDSPVEPVEQRVRAAVA
jgi:hypothetical protein